MDDLRNTLECLKKYIAQEDEEIQIKVNKMKWMNLKIRTASWKLKKKKIKAKDRRTKGWFRN